MFDNIGAKLKIVAKVFFWIGVAFCALTILGGLASAQSLQEGLVAIISGLAGVLVSWISSWVLYGFGQLIENSDKLVWLSCKKLETEAEQSESIFEDESCDAQDNE